MGGCMGSAYNKVLCSPQTPNERVCHAADTTSDDAVNVQDLMTVLANFGCTMEDCGHPCGQLHEDQDAGR